MGGSYFKMKSFRASCVPPKFVTCSCHALVRPSSLPSHLSRGQRDVPLCHLEPFFTHLLLCPWILAHLSSPFLAHGPLGGKDHSYLAHQHFVGIPSDTRAPEPFILAPATGETHTKYFFSEWATPDSGCGRSGGCGGLSKKKKKPICRKRSVLRASLEPQGFRGSKTHTCHQGRRKDRE